MVEYGRSPSQVPKPSLSQASQARDLSQEACGALDSGRMQRFPERSWGMGLMAGLWGGCRGWLAPSWLAGLGFGFCFLGSGLVLPFTSDFLRVHQ